MFLFLFALLGFQAAQAFCEDAPVLENLDVEAYNFDYDLLSVPSNNTYISREQILDSAASGIAEILQSKANILFRSTSGSTLNGEIAMRGYGENSASRVLVIVDGRRLNPADLSSVNWLQIPLDNVESIEVLRGSHSALYGNNAVAGVIKIKTLKGSDEGSASVRVLGGSYGLYSVNANLLGRYGDFFGSIEGSLFHDGGCRKNSKIFNKSVNAGLGCDFDEKKTLDFSVNFSDQYVEFPGALTWRDARDNPRKSDLAFEQNGNLNLGMLAASFKNKSGIGDGEILLGANMRDAKWSMSGTWYDNSQYGASVNLKQDARINEILSLLGGVDINFDSINYDAYLEKERRHKTEISDIKRLTLGAYAGGEWEALESLKITCAARGEAAYTCGEDTRYDRDTIPEYIIRKGRKIKNPLYQNPPAVLSHFDDSMWQSGVAANFGLNYMISDEASVFFRFDQIYRYPSTDEIADYQGYGGFPRPFNSGLKAEHGQNYEIGAKYFFEGFSCVLNFFYQRLNNEITFDGAHSENINLPPTERYGVDFSLSYDSEYWGASAMASILDARFCGGEFGGKKIPLVPSYTITNSVYVRPLENLTITARMRYVGEQVQGLDFQNEYRKIPDYCVFDFQANFKPCEYAEIFVALENAFDKRYISAAWLGGFYPACGRTLKVGVNLRF